MGAPNRPASALLEKVRARLLDLKMSTAREVVEELWNEALRQGLDGLDFLHRLLDQEAVERYSKRLERRITSSKLPKEVKTLESFDWAFPAAIDKGRILGLARLDFLRDRLNVIITGKSGTGKSHIAQALGFLACGADVRVRYTSCAAMLNDLYAGLADHTLERRLRRYQRPELLIIDDLGTEKVEILHGQGASFFFKVVNFRYGKASTIITSNLDRDAWDSYFGDPNVTVAALDRLTHHAIPVIIDGDSYRVHQMEARMQQAGAKKTKKPRSSPRSSSGKRRQGKA
jgi:DNA replication protein DnaC